jgi:small subunit ribosomal protein S13
MPRILGVDIPTNKRLVISLTYIYGIGLARSKQIIKALELSENTKARELSEEEVSRIIKHLQDPTLFNDPRLKGEANSWGPLIVEGDLRRLVSTNVKRLVGINCYRGNRHKNGLPVRGQRTRTNARTRKGKRKTVANKKM